MNNGKNFFDKLVKDNKITYELSQLSQIKTQLPRMMQSEGFLGSPLGPLLKTGVLLRENVIDALAKRVLIPLLLTAAASAADAGTHQKFLGSGNTTLTILNDEVEDIIKIFKYLEDSPLLSKRVSDTVQNEAKKKGGFPGMLLGTLGALSLGNMLARKGMNRAREGFLRASYGYSIKNKTFWYCLII